MAVGEEQEVEVGASSEMERLVVGLAAAEEAVERMVFLMVEEGPETLVAVEEVALEEAKAWVEVEEEGTAVASGEVAEMAGEGVDGTEPV